MGNRLILPETADFKMKNIQTYTEEMSKSLAGKSFFTEHITPDTIIDYGCADGRLGEFIQATGRFEGNYVGYDINREMLALAKERNPDMKVFDDFQQAAQAKKGSTAVVANSVLHEMFSEGVEHYFYRHVFDLKPKYVAIRDMALDEETKRRPVVQEKARKLISKLPEKMVEEYEFHVGSVKNYKYLIQLLFKSRFRENWETELYDDYFAVNKDSLMVFLELLGYKPIMDNEYALPFLKDYAKDNYNLDLNHPTHFKYIGVLKD